MRQRFVTLVTSEGGLWALSRYLCNEASASIALSNWPGRGHIVSYSCLLRITPSFSEELLQSHSWIQLSSIGMGLWLLANPRVPELGPRDELLTWPEPVRMAPEQCWMGIERILSFPFGFRLWGSASSKPFEGIKMKRPRGSWSKRIQENPILPLAVLLSEVLLRTDTAPVSCLGVLLFGWS